MSAASIAEMMASTEMKKRMQALHMFDQMCFEDREFNLENKESKALLKPLRGLLSDANANLCQSALCTFERLILEHGAASKLYLNSTLKHVLPRLSHSRSSVRSKAHDVLLAFMRVLDAQAVSIFEQHIQPIALSNRVAGARYEVLKLYEDAIAEHGHIFVRDSITSGLSMCMKLLMDPNEPVRELAIAVLAHLFAFVGEPLRIFLWQHVRTSQCKALAAAFDHTSLSPLEQRVSLPLMSLPVPSTPSSGSRKTRVSPDITASSSDSDDDDVVPLSAAVAPLHVSSEREVESIIDEIGKALQDVTSNSWKDRIAALHRFVALVKGVEAGHCVDLHLHNLPKMLRKLCPPLITQLHELRSAVAKEACAVVCFLAVVLRHDFSGMAERILPQLLKLTFASIAVISHSGRACMRTIIRYSPPNNALLKLIDTAKSSKNAALRATAMQCIQLTLHSHTTESLDRYAVAILACLSSVLSDANGDARIAARQCVWSANQHWPDRVQELLETLDPAVRTHLERVRNEPSQNPNPIRIAATPSENHHSRRRSAPFKVEKEKERKSTISDSKAERVAVSSSALSSTPSMASKQHLGGAMRVMRAMASSPPSSSSSSSNTVASDPQRTAQRRPILQEIATSDSSSNSNLKTADRHLPKEDVFSWEAFFSEASSKDWRIRQDAFSRLKYRLESSSIMLSDCSRSVGRLLQIYESRVSDKHHKVAGECLGSLIAFISRVDLGELRPSIGRLLGGVLQRQHDPKPFVREAAQQVVEEFERRVGFVDLYPELVRLLASPSVKVQLSSFESILRLLHSSEAETHLQSPHYLRHFLNRLRSFLYVRAPDLKDTLSQVIRAIAELDLASFQKAIHGWPPADITKLAKLTGIVSAEAAEPEIVPLSSDAPTPVEDRDNIDVLSERVESMQLQFDDADEADPGRSPSAIGWSPSARNLLNGGAVSVRRGRMAVDLDQGMAETFSSGYDPESYESLLQHKENIPVGSSGDIPPSESIPRLLVNLSPDRAIGNVDRIKLLRQVQGCLEKIETECLSAELANHILSSLKSMTGVPDLHVHISSIIQTMLKRFPYSISSSCSTLMACLFDLDTIGDDKVHLFEIAASVFDSSECINVVVEKMSNSLTPKMQLVYSLEFTSFLLVNTMQDRHEIDQALDLILPCLPDFLKHTALEVRKTALYSILDLYKLLGEEPLRSLFLHIEDRERKLLVAYMKKTGLKLPQVYS